MDIFPKGHACSAISPRVLMTTSSQDERDLSAHATSCCSATGLARLGILGKSNRHPGLGGTPGARRGPVLLPRCQACLLLGSLVGLLFNPCLPLCHGLPKEGRTLGKGISPSRFLLSADVKWQRTNCLKLTELQDAFDRELTAAQPDLEGQSPALTLTCL